MYRYLIIFIILCGCTGQSGTAEVVEDGFFEHHEWQVGDTWTFLPTVKGYPTTGRASLAFTVVSDGENGTVVLEKVSRYANATVMVEMEHRDPDTLEMSAHEVLAPEGAVQERTEYSPPIGGIRYPLYVGKTWNDRSAALTYEPNGSKDEWVQELIDDEVRVASREEVTTPAGTFDTFKMELVDRTAGEVTFEGEMFFAPAIGKYVLLRSGNFELVLINYSIN